MTKGRIKKPRAQGQPNHVCLRCGRPLVPGREQGWNTFSRLGVIQGVVCLNCQTPEENSEAEINDATFDYAGEQTWDWRHHSSRENKPVIAAAMMQEARSAWREYRDEYVDATGAVNLDALADRAADELPAPWSKGREHCRALIRKALNVVAAAEQPRE